MSYRFWRGFVWACAGGGEDGVQEKGSPVWLREFLLGLQAAANLLSEQLFEEEDPSVTSGVVFAEKLMWWQEKKPQDTQWTGVAKILGGFVPAGVSRGLTLLQRPQGCCLAPDPPADTP